MYCTRVWVIELTTYDIIMKQYRPCCTSQYHLFNAHPHSNIMEVINEHHDPRPSTYKLPSLGTPGKGALPKYAVPQFAQFTLQMRRNVLHSVRDGSYNGVRFAYTVLTALILGLLWWNQANKRYVQGGTSEQGYQHWYHITFVFQPISCGPFMSLVSTYSTGKAPRA